MVTAFLPLSGIQRTCTLRKKTMPFGPQYSIEFGKTSMSINGPEFAVGVAQAEGRLAGIDAGAEQFELKLRLQLTEARRGGRFHPQPALANPEIGMPIGAEFISEGWQFCGPNDIEPVGVVLF